MTDATNTPANDADAKRKAAIDMYEAHLKVHGTDAGPIPSFTQWMACELRNARKNMVGQFAKSYDEIKARDGVPSATQNLAAELRRAHVELEKRNVNMHEVSFVVQLGDEGLTSKGIDNLYGQLEDKLKQLPGWMKKFQDGLSYPVLQLCEWEFSGEDGDVAPYKLVIAVKSEVEIPYTSGFKLSVKDLLTKMPGILAEVFGEGTKTLSASFYKKYATSEQGDYRLTEAEDGHS